MVSLEKDTDRPIINHIYNDYILFPGLCRFVTKEVSCTYSIAICTGPGCSKCNGIRHPDWNYDLIRKGVLFLYLPDGNIPGHCSLVCEKSSS